MLTAELLEEFYNELYRQRLAKLELQREMSTEFANLQLTQKRIDELWVKIIETEQEAGQSIGKIKLAAELLGVETKLIHTL